MPVSIKSRVGRYEILSRIGAGGMGEVYRARDTKLARDVAIKVLPEEFVRDPGRMARFEREAKCLAALNHPNIAAIYGVEDAGATDALVMELAEGPTLADRIASGPIPLAEALPIARKIADALEYAHEHGIVHRDLKPANITVSRDGSVKVLDFGLARLAEGATDTTDIGNAPTITQMATESGVLLGTVAYMSPEQVKARPVDRRADIWAFSCVLYEMLTGKKAFPAETATETLAAVLTNEPDWSQLPTDTPILLRVLLHRCLQKDPKQRLRDVGDARISLDEILTGATQDAPALTPARSRTIPLSIALALVSLLAASVAYRLFTRQYPLGQPARMTVLLPERSRPLSLAVSPDGHAIAMVLLKDGKQQIWIRALDALEPTALEGTDGAMDPFWSPDSRSIAFFADARLKKIDRSGGPVQTLCDALGALGGTWNRNGDILFGGLRRLQRISSAGGPVSDLPNHPDVNEVYPFFLPDGEHYLATRATDGHSAETGVWLGSIHRPDLRKILPDTSKAQLMGPPSGSNIGAVLFTRAGTLMALPFDLKRLTAAGDAFLVAQGTATIVSADLLAAASNAGVLAYVSGQDGGSKYVWRDRQGRNLGAYPDAGFVAMISPDGKQLAGDRNRDTWVMEFAHGVATRLTFGPPGNMNPIWSPDHRYIAYDKIGVGIYRKPANGAGEEELLVPSKMLAAPKSWSRDGRFIAYSQVDGGGAVLMAISLDGDRKPFPLVQTAANEDQGQFSPDGHWLAYTSNESGQSEIYVIPFPPSGRGKWLVSRGGGVQPRWRPNGKELFYIAPDSKMMSVQVQTQPVFHSGTPHSLFQTDIVDTGVRTGPFSWDLAPDGQRFLIITPNSSDTSFVTVALNWRAETAK